MDFFDVKRIYLDHAAGAPLDRRVFEVMKPYFLNEQGNPSAIYREGVEAKKAVEDARADIARALSARPDEIIFTSGGTEANNAAIFGVVRAAREAEIKKPHIITSVIEHPSVLNVCRALEARGDVEVTYISVDADGIVQLEEIRKALKKETILVSIMYANNEIGTIQPIREIAKIIRSNRKNFKKTDLGVSPLSSGNITERSSAFPYLHTDACQAMNYLDININRLGVDLLTFNGAKIYGPKGVGVLYVKRGVKIVPIFFGGGQERNLRAGTENVPAIVGTAKALEIARVVLEKESARQTKLRDYFVSEIKKYFPDVMINGSIMERLPNNINVSFMGIESQLMVIELDARGISASSKSACSSEDEDASYVVSALGGAVWRADNSVRFSIGRATREKDIQRTLRVLRDIVKKYKTI